MQESIRFLKDLLQINSVNPPGNEEPVARAIAAKLQENGIESTIRPLGPNRAYLVAGLKGKGNKKSLVFSGHMDTVAPGDLPWVHEPFAAEEVDGRIFGRGASDMKGGLAALTMAMIEIARSGVLLAGHLVLAATAGEEVDSFGARAMVEDGVLNDTGAMVIGEPSNGEIFVAHKGALWLEVVSYGKTAHGSMPEQGINAIENTYAFINALHTKFQFKYQEDKLLGEPTLNLATISGGVKTNVVPDMCRLQIDMRTVPGQNHQEILADVKALLTEIEENSNARFELKILNNLGAVGTPTNHPFVQLALGAAGELFGRNYQPKGVKFYTDASTFVPGLGNKLPVIIYGPGKETNAHQPNEYVEISKYLEAIKFYKEIALRYFG